VRNNEYGPSHHFNPDIPVWVDSALEKAVKVNAEDRYEAHSKFMADLSKPNPDFVEKNRIPIMERILENPVRYPRHHRDHPAPDARPLTDFTELRDCPLCRYKLIPRRAAEGAECEDIFLCEE